MLVPMRAILEAADKYRYGQAAFNMNSVGQIEAAIRIHELLRSGAILQGAEASNAYMSGELDFMHGTPEQKAVGAKNIGDTVKKYGADSPIPIALHLDHGKTLESVKACIAGGYTSVMIDGSSLPYEDNVELTREVVKYAHPYGVTVEGELGVLAGVEDHVFSATSTYTNPMQAVDFFKKTGCDALAISYGTCHGANKGKDTKIRREIAIATKECMLHEGISGFLVSHGSSTVPQEYVQQINAMGGQLENAFGIDVAQLVDVAHCGINKINVDTDIRLACTRNIMELFRDHPELKESPSIGQVYRDMAANPKNFDPRNYTASIMDAILYGKIADEDVAKVVECMKNGVTESIAPLLVQFGSYRKSNLIEPVTCEQMADRYKKEGI
ncbi:class II fructose-bisphosphate aldolase [Subdoligranulum sp. DSM 109015]|uniref:Class II fructose-bisphosphate aldolase n=1 Tax=Gemmiger gallinarum TaxID=2779354 RepID=A0ABR9R3E1_9FIRM|nr:class II fructose-bisphosphate aldolase [Gemmiger gallinarum]MBE5037668.1 class II fructose-bisphosphate aldolase [Gemmiger gallinarum]MBE5038650.1 class II fructose-bisphosphate aldolase [Gemmiger gallinarum]